MGQVQDIRQLVLLEGCSIRWTARSLGISGVSRSAGTSKRVSPGAGNTSRALKPESAVGSEADLRVAVRVERQADGQAADHRQPPA